jgi:hypothetical protein
MTTNYCEIQADAQEAIALVISNLWNLCNLWMSS